MGLRRATPGEGGKKARVHFGYVSTAPGKVWDAFIAGPCYWCLAHCTGHSKPCLDWMTGGELTCKRCNPLKPAEEIGYQPLYRDSDGRPVFVIVHSYSREKVDGWKFREKVRVARGTDSADAVCLMPILGKKEWYTSTLAERQVPADLTETLLRVWGLPELESWYRAQEKQSDNGVSLAPPQKKSDGSPFGPMTATAARRFAPPAPKEGPSADTFDELRESIKKKTENLKPSTNGKHE